MAIKTKHGSQWVNVYGSSIEVKRNVSIDTTLTKSGWAADAKSVGRQIGDISDLNTTHKDNLVDALNEVALNAGSGAQLVIVTFDEATSKASHTRDQIAEIVNNKKVILGSSSSGEVLTFTMIGVHNSIESVALFENTKVETTGDAVTTFYAIDAVGNFTTNQHYHENLIDKIPDAKKGQIVVIDEVDKQKGYPIKWKAQDLEKADNGIIIIEINAPDNGSTVGLTASLGTTEIKNCLDKGQFLYVNYNNNYYPYIGFKDETALFYLTEINENTAKGKFIFIYENQDVTYHEETMGQLDYIQNPSIAERGQVLMVEEVDENKIPIKWIAANITIPDEYVVPECDFISLGLPTIYPNQENVKIEGVDGLLTCITNIQEGPVKIKYKYGIEETDIEISSIASTFLNMESNTYILTCFEYISNTLPTIITFILAENTLEAYAHTINADLLQVISNPDFTNSKVGQALAIKAIAEDGKVEWETVDFPKAGDTIIKEDYNIPTFDLIDFSAVTTFSMRASATPVSSIKIIPDTGPIAIVADITNILTALEKGPIIIQYQYVLSTEEIINVKTTINPTYIAESNSYIAEFIEQFENIPRLVIFTFEDFKLTANSITLNNELKNYILTPVEETKIGQLLAVKSVTENNYPKEWELIDPITGLPDYTIDNQNQYVTPDENGKLVWKELPEATNENAGIVIINKDLDTSGHAADAKAVGDRLTSLETKGSGSFFVIIQNDNTCSHTFEQIVTAINNGFSIIAIYNNKYIPLTQYTTNELILFHITTIINSELTGLFISITPSQTVNITIEKIQIATPQQAGLVKPTVEWSADMKSSVSVDATGSLWFKTDKTLSNANEAADAAAVRSEIERLEKLIATLNPSFDFTVTSDAEGNVTIVKMTSWTVSNEEYEDVVISGGHWKVSDATNSDVVISSP